MSHVMSHPWRPPCLACFPHTAAAASQVCPALPESSSSSPLKGCEAGGSGVQACVVMHSCLPWLLGGGVGAPVGSVQARRWRPQARQPARRASQAVAWEEGRGWDRTGGRGLCTASRAQRAALLSCAAVPWLVLPRCATHMGSLSSPSRASARLPEHSLGWGRCVRAGLQQLSWQAWVDGWAGLYLPTMPLLLLDVADKFLGFVPFPGLGMHPCCVALFGLVCWERGVAVCQWERHSPSPLLCNGVGTARREVSCIMHNQACARCACLLTAAVIPATRGTVGQN